MPLQPEIWQNDIVGGLYKGNEFLLRAVNADQYVTGGRIVHIPQAGTGSNVSKNRTSLPATVSQRTDTDITYPLDEYTSDPILIPNIDTIQLSYNKRETVMIEDQAKLNEKVADGVLSKWTSTIGAGQILRTTGDLADTTTTGATGQRRLFVKGNLLKAKTLMDNQKIPAVGRVALISPEFAETLINDKDLSVNFEKYADLANGVIGRLYGFDIMVRPEPVRFTNAGTPAPKDSDAATAASDNVAALCWHPVAVERALGQVKMFERQNDPQFFGDVYSWLVMMGGRARRADGKGMVAIVESAS